MSGYSRANRRRPTRREKIQGGDPRLVAVGHRRPGEAETTRKISPEMRELAEAYAGMMNRDPEALYNKVCGDE